MRKFFSALTVMAAITACVSAQNVDVEVINPKDVIEIGDLTEIAYDFKINPLKSKSHIDRIGGIKSWDDGKVMLARNGNSDKVMRFDNYEFKGAVDGLGKPEQYFYIEDFSYDKANNSIYIENGCRVAQYAAMMLPFTGPLDVTLSHRRFLKVGGLKTCLGL